MRQFTDGNEPSLFRYQQLKHLFMDKVLPVSTRAWRNTAKTHFTSNHLCAARVTSKNHWFGSAPANASINACGNVLQFHSTPVDRSLHDGETTVRFAAITGVIIWVSKPDEHGIGVKLLDDDTGKECVIALPVSPEAFAFGERVTVVHALHSESGPVHLLSVNLVRNEWWSHQNARSVSRLFEIDNLQFVERLERRMREIVVSLDAGRGLRVMGARANLRLA